MPSTSHTPEIGKNQAKIHLYQIDFIRALTVLGVIMVHVIFFTNPPNSSDAGAVIMLLHYTREVFLFLTGFVLFYTYPSRPIAWPVFWRRRFRLIAIPYILWTLIYAYISTYPGFGQALPFAHRVLIDLLQGTAWYHLYYLLITMQIYLLFPAFQWLIDRTRRHHRLLFVLSLALELALMLWYQADRAGGGLVGSFMPYRDMAFFSYQLYLLAGALAATHLPKLDEIVKLHRRAVMVAWTLSSVAVLSTYILSREEFHVSPVIASMVFQPIMVPYCLATILLLYSQGSLWAKNVRVGMGQRALAGLSHHSFGLYLIHPLILYAVLGDFDIPLTPYWPILHSALVFSLTLSISYLAVWLIALTPISWYLMGRPGKSTLSFLRPLQWRYHLRLRTRPLSGSRGTE